ncbi:hypothetical protein [Microcystis aeruginosa]|jgi:hypothetical protein|uniref:Uncharacterized protein n=3 Tax=Microcystis aeruginosa TaxID=1126 RepID=A0A6H9FQK0_MICAE|nr:hypothetical protein [Microcystis aeruginosa]MCZ8129605.1 hypothetical protein [Microcystis sp. LE19-114.1B]NCR98722.1 hypothetical protein [Microcystis aeruginosa L311-01]OCY15636.1 MAG: hypothetical protein BEV12_14120 [Microcystis aeruginosa CACIAM 03]TRU12628.1 MAG: hypothetical protein EWV59_08285 [Microcystis aeruginosa Ma_MB_F_20061100_S19D]TRU19064.1 MAG: hypothetical protein EWV58_00310 [Microcystis aeruginosa Ma_MB_F_20061100_S19]
MPLTAAEKQEVLNMLERMDEEAAKKVIATESAFSLWLKTNLYPIFVKIKDALQSMWQSIRNFFS